MAVYSCRKLIYPQMIGGLQTELLGGEPFPFSVCGWLCPVGVHPAARACLAYCPRGICQGLLYPIQLYYKKGLALPITPCLPQGWGGSSLDSFLEIFRILQSKVSCVGIDGILCMTMPSSV